MVREPPASGDPVGAAKRARCERAGALRLLGSAALVLPFRSARLAFSLSAVGLCRRWSLSRALLPGRSKFLFPEGSGAGISTPSASADPLLAGAGTAASAVVGCSRERARAASSALADIAAGSRCYPRDVFAAARPLLLARKEERCVGARSRSTSVHSNNSLCSEIGRLANPPS